MASSPPSHAHDTRAFGLAAACLARAGLLRRPVVGVAVAMGDGVCLGARVHAERVLGPEAPAAIRVVRRTTSGPSFAFRGAAVVLAMALPSVDTLHRDATPATFLNRNVRPLLHALRHAGVRATYLGRDWISAGSRPLAQLGYDAEEGGAFVLEAWLSAEAGLEIPPEHLSDLMRAATLRRGLRSVALRDVVDGSVDAFLTRLREGLLLAVSGDAEVLDVAHALPAQIVVSPDSPLAVGATWLPPHEVPIGYVDRARSGDTLFLGGDVIARVSAFDDVQGRRDGIEPILGASWVDLAELARAAR